MRFLKPASLALLVLLTACGKDTTVIVVPPVPTATAVPTPFPTLTDPGCYAPPDHPDACN